MNESTIGDVWRKREELERNAAAALGRALFEFSRLETNLGLMVMCIRDHLRGQEPAENSAALNLKARLDFVEEYTATNADVVPAARAALGPWLTLAHEARHLRNQLVHGCWGVDASGTKAVNVVDIRGNGEQQIFMYTLEELEAIGAGFRRLNVELGSIRKRWHLP